ncbi:TPA: hypothetical protein QDB23_001700 [Burkholderia vietnamiensis]|nr:hypothetical protein [Burkholderia vietnamiensis]
MAVWTKSERYEDACKAREILDLEHSIDIGQLKTIDDVRAALRARGDRINEKLNAHGFKGWENGIPIFE